MYAKSTNKILSFVPGNQIVHMCLSSLCSTFLKYLEYSNTYFIRRLNSRRILYRKAGKKLAYPALKQSKAHYCAKDAQRLVARLPRSPTASSVLSKVMSFSLILSLLLSTFVIIHGRCKYICYLCLTGQRPVSLSAVNSLHVQCDFSLSSLHRS